MSENSQVADVRRSSRPILKFKTAKARVERRRLVRGIRRVACLLAAMGLACEAQAIPAPLNVAGSPVDYDVSTQTGIAEIYMYSGSVVNNSGTAVGYSTVLQNGRYVGVVPVRWDGSGTAATVLEDFGVNVFSGVRTSVASAINDAGTAVGFSDRLEGRRAVRWNASGTAVTELGAPEGSTEYFNTWAYAINNAGTAVGHAGTAVRWDASGTATLLENLGQDSNGDSQAHAFAINDVGTAVGYSRRWNANNIESDHAVRWDGSGTAVTELAGLGVDPDGWTEAKAYAINEAGTAVGYSWNYQNGVYSRHAARWDGSGTAITVLGGLGEDFAGYTDAQADAINDAGTAVGYAYKYVGGVFKGVRAVRWDGSSTVATELGDLGLDGSGATQSYAHAVNDAGTAVGYVQKYVNGVFQGDRAVIWLPDASVIDLNNLGVVPVPAGGTWLLITAQGLSSDGWVAGSGVFTATDGSAYGRGWVTQIGLGGEWTDDFSGSLDGTWGRGKQWSTGTPAMQVGNATFNANAAYTVSLDRDELTNHIQINAGIVTLNHNGFTLTATDGVTIAHGAMLKGGGMIFGDVMVEGTIAPGNSPGTMPIMGNSTWAGGGSYLWEINKAEGTAGADPGWDIYDITGVLNITASSGNEFTIDLTTLDLFNAAGQMNGFDSTIDYVWTIATADGGITGFDASNFILNLAGFANTFSGTFGIARDGNNINLTYRSAIIIPEPATASLAMMGLGGLMMRCRRMA